MEKRADCREAGVANDGIVDAGQQTLTALPRSSPDWTEEFLV